MLRNISRKYIDTKTTGEVKYQLSSYLNYTVSVTKQEFENCYLRDFISKDLLFPKIND